MFYYLFLSFMCIRGIIKTTDGTYVRASSISMPSDTVWCHNHIVHMAMLILDPGPNGSQVVRK